MASRYKKDISEFHTEEVQDIITAVPSWMIRWGITLIFCILVCLVSFSAFIKYPDILKTELVFFSENSPKPVVSKIQGKLVKLLVNEGQAVKEGQLLAFIESTAQHDEVLKLLTQLKRLQTQIASGKPPETFFLNNPNNRLGELQSAYQTFYKNYLFYKSSNDGFYSSKVRHLKMELLQLTKNEEILKLQVSTQKRDLSIAADQYSMHKKLKEKNIETLAELRTEESKYLAKKIPLAQSEAALVANSNDYLMKEMQIIELNNQIMQEKDQFFQALSTLINEIEDWKHKYILKAGQDGRVVYAGLLQLNQVLRIDQEIFNINNKGNSFIGQVLIPQNNMGKVQTGQKVLIKLVSFPFEEFGILNGQVVFISDAPYRDNLFIVKVEISSKQSNLDRRIKIKHGMLAEADIITQDASLLTRILREVIRMVN